MNKSNKKQYKLMSSVTIEQLKENNFRYIEGYYSYRFPVYKNKKDILLWCNLNVDFENKTCVINVTDSNNNTYSPYHNRDYGKNKVVESVDRKINQQMNIFIKNKILIKK
jgi:hypothetical protein